MSKTKVEWLQLLDDLATATEEWRKQEIKRIEDETKFLESIKPAAEALAGDVKASVAVGIDKAIDEFLS